MLELKPISVTYEVSLEHSDWVLMGIAEQFLLSENDRLLNLLTPLGVEEIILGRDRPYVRLSIRVMKNSKPVRLTLLQHLEDHIGACRDLVALRAPHLMEPRYAA